MSTHASSFQTQLQAQLQAQKDALFSMRLADDTQGVADGLLNLARLQGILEQHKDARVSYEEAVQLFRKQKNATAEAECLRGIGVVCAHLADVRGALVHLSEAAGIYKEEKDVPGEALCHAAAAEVVRATGDLEQAEAGMSAALELFRQVHDHPREAALLLDIGDIRMERGKYAEARESYREALPIARDQKGELLARCLLLLGEAEGFSKNHAEARTCSREAAELFHRAGDAANEARARWDQGMALFFLGQHVEATGVFERTRELFEALGDSDGLIRVRNVLASLAAKQKQAY